MTLRALTVVALLAAASPAVADTAREQAAAVVRAKAHFERGRQLSETNQFAAAYAEFAAGYAASPRPLFQFNMGECARALGRTVDARDHYQRYLAAEPKGAFAPTARTRLADLPDARAPGQGATTSPPARTGSTTTTAPAPAPAPRPASPPTMHAISTGHEAEPTPAVQTLPAPAPADGSGEMQLTGTRSFGTPREASRPLYKRPVFWVGVGVAVAGGVALTYAMTRDPSCTGASCVDLR